MSKRSLLCRHDNRSIQPFFKLTGNDTASKQLSRPILPVYPHHSTLPVLSMNVIYILIAALFWSTLKTVSSECLIGKLCSNVLNLSQNQFKSYKIL